MPAHANFRFAHLLFVGLGYLASASFVVFVGLPISPWVVWIAALASVVGTTGLYLDGWYRKSGADEWKKRIKTIAGFTDQFLGENGMFKIAMNRTEVLADHANRTGRVLTAIGSHQQDQADQIAMLKSENQQLKSMLCKLQARMDALEGKGSINTLERQAAPEGHRLTLVG